MYNLFKSFYFGKPPEDAHRSAMGTFRLLLKIPMVKKFTKTMFEVSDPRLERTVAGLKFKNPVGLAAGFDKDARYIHELACLGFGFIEIGTVTPLPQPGNDLPRLFRIEKDEALINRMGFNNDGVDRVAARMIGKKPNCIIGGNIGRGKMTHNDKAFDDFKIGFEKLYPYVDYFVINVSSPNTPGLRELQDKEPLIKILNGLQYVNKFKSKTKPIFLKIAPDLTNTQLDDIIEIVKETRISGVIATNTTVGREGLSLNETALKKIGHGGLSGKPLKNRSTEVVRYLAEKSEKSFAIIAVGGILSPEDALEKIAAGADLVQIYTGLIYKGPSLIKQINQAILQSK